MTTSIISSPAITVLMSCHNAARWLDEAVNSVLNQTFKDFEFILVDDGSKDETLKKIRQFAARDNRIVVVKKHNTGLSDSLNVGIERARGKWIARLDADDLCEPTRLEKQLNFVRRNPEVVLLGTGFMEIDEEGCYVKKHKYPSSHRRLVRHLERMQRFFPHSSAFYSAELVRQVGGYRTQFTRAEDWCLWLELAKCGKIACLQDHLVRIRKHANQISHAQNGRRQICDSTAITICHFLQKAGFRDPFTNTSADQIAEFMSWVENCLEMSGFFERKEAWANARALYFSGKNRSIGALRFGKRLLQSSHASALMREKVFGSSLPQRLAREWMNR